MVRQITLSIIGMLTLISCKKECSCPTPLPTDPLKNGLIAYYPFNGNTSDESGNNNHGAATGGSFTTDKNNSSNKAFIFDGNDYLKVLSSPSLSSVGTTFTMTAWVYNEQQETYVVCKAPYNGSTMQFRLYSDNGMIHFANYGKSVDFNNSLNPVNSWKHITVSSNGTSAKYYLNGVLVNTLSLNSASGVDNNTSDMYIGSDTHGVVEFYKGKLDEIRIYNRVLSDAEVLQLYNL